MLGFPVHISEGQKLVLNSLRILRTSMSVVSYEWPVLVKVTHELVFIEVACKEKSSAGGRLARYNLPIELFRRNIPPEYSSLCNNLHEIWWIKFTIN